MVRVRSRGDVAGLRVAADSDDDDDALLLLLFILLVASGTIGIDENQPDTARDTAKRRRYIFSHFLVRDGGNGGMPVQSLGSHRYGGRPKFRHVMVETMHKDEKDSFSTLWRRKWKESFRVMTREFDTRD